MSTTFDVSRKSLLQGFNHSLQINKLLINACPIENLLIENSIKSIDMVDSTTLGQTRMTITWAVRTKADIKISLIVSLMKNLEGDNSLLKIVLEDPSECDRLLSHTVDKKPHHRSNKYASLRERISTYNKTIAFEYFKFANNILSVDDKYISRHNPKRDILSINSTINGTRPYNILTATGQGSYLYTVVYDRIMAILKRRGEAIGEFNKDVNSITYRYAKTANILYCPVTESVWLKFSDIADTMGEFSQQQKYLILGQNSAAKGNKNRLLEYQTSPTETAGFDEWIANKYTNVIVNGLQLTSLGIIRELHKLD